MVPELFFLDNLDRREHGRLKALFSEHNGKASLLVHPALGYPRDRSNRILLNENILKIVLWGEDNRDFFKKESQEAINAFFKGPVILVNSKVGRGIPSMGWENALKKLKVLGFSHGTLSGNIANLVTPKGWQKALEIIIKKGKVDAKIYREYSELLLKQMGKNLREIKLKQLAGVCVLEAHHGLLKYGPLLGIRVSLARGLMEPEKIDRKTMRSKSHRKTVKPVIKHLKK